MVPHHTTAHIDRQHPRVPRGVCGMRGHLGGRKTLPRPVGEHQDAGAGTRHDRREPLGTQSPDELVGLDHRLGAVRLVELVLGGREQQVRALRESRDEQRRTREIEDRVFARDLQRVEPRATEVDIVKSGTNTSGATPRCTSSFLCCGPCSSTQAIVRPPNRAGATLSGWPSSSVARRSSASAPISTSPARRPFAARSPDTTAAPDEPIPRPCGIALTASRRTPGIVRPNASYA